METTATVTPTATPTATVPTTSASVRRYERYQRDEIDALKRDFPLVEVLTAHGIDLKPGGPGTHWALCPFHTETEPSFFVDVRDPQDEHFHCFGECGAHGDVIKFIQLRDRVPFYEACGRLAGSPRPLPRPSPAAARAPQRQAERRWDRLTLEEQVVMNTACAVYQHTLWHHQRALAYLRSRGLS
jgi:DNA primase